MDFYLSIAKAINDEIDDAFNDLSRCTSFGHDELQDRIRAIVERNLTADAPEPQEAKLADCSCIAKETCLEWSGSRCVLKR